jgi:hypothetical protein
LTLTLETNLIIASRALIEFFLDWILDETHYSRETRSSVAALLQKDLDANV